MVCVLIADQLLRSIRSLNQHLRQVLAENNADSVVRGVFVEPLPLFELRSMRPYLLFFRTENKCIVNQLLTAETSNFFRLERPMRRQVLERTREQIDFDTDVVHYDGSGSYFRRAWQPGPLS